VELIVVYPEQKDSARRLRGCPVKRARTRHTCVGCGDDEIDRTLPAETGPAASSAYLIVANDSRTTASLGIALQEGWWWPSDANQVKSCLAQSCSVGREATP
jgi:hypothetical protein